VLSLAEVSGTRCNPHFDFYTHYSRLSGLQRLSLETHTVNGTQISRYEPDISHSTTGMNGLGLVDSALERASFCPAPASAP
jgi:hypothetical protein